MRSESRDKQILIHHFLEESAKAFPDKCAMVHGDVRVTFKELNRDANRIARYLIERGVCPADRVMLLLENCREYIAGYYGCLKAGGVAVPLNPDLKPDTLSSLLAQTTPRAIISSSRCEKTLKETDISTLSDGDLLIAKPKLRLHGARDLAEITCDGDESTPQLPVAETDLASIIFTSGSTGRPKGVMLSHGNIVANTCSIVSYLELTSADIQMVVLPFFYVMGKSLLNTHMAVGGTVVINNQFAYPAGVVRQMIDEKVTGFSGVPSTYAYLLHRSPFREMRGEFEALRYCSQAGGHMARHIKEELLKALPPHTRLFVMYGATEASARLTYVEPRRLAEKIDSIGIPIPGVTMRVLDKHGQELRQGETGELVASGPNIMAGYWRDPEGTAKALGNRGYHTGDMGYRDEDGYFFVVGRKDDQLKVGGHRVDPREIEDAIIGTDMVIETAVLGMEDPLSGQRLAALAVPLNGDITARDIIAACSRLLPRHKIPAEVRLVRTLPKNSSGKVDKKECQRLLVD